MNMIYWDRLSGSILSSLHLTDQNKNEARDYIDSLQPKFSSSLPANDALNMIFMSLPNRLLDNYSRYELVNVVYKIPNVLTNGE